MENLAYAKQPNFSESEIESLFKTWYAQYPRKADPRRALRIYSRILQTGRATPEELLQGARDYADEKTDTAKQYIKHAANWLMFECWIQY